MRTTFGGEVVPFWAQTSAQHNFAASSSGVLRCMRAALQQSMSIMSMAHSLSPRRNGMPAITPPDSTSKRTRDESRFFITATLLKSPNQSQHPKFTPAQKISWTKSPKASATAVPPGFLGTFA